MRIDVLLNVPKSHQLVREVLKQFVDHTYRYFILEYNTSYFKNKFY